MKFFYELVEIDSENTTTRIDTTTRWEELEEKNVTSPNIVIVYKVNKDGNYKGYRTLQNIDDLEDWRISRERELWAKSNNLEDPKENPVENKKLKEAIRFNEGKPDWSLMPLSALEEVVKVLQMGAKKYDKNNWREGSGFNYTSVVASMMRHIVKYMDGIDVDDESKLHHMAHVACNALFLLYYSQHPDRYNNDDRFKG